VPVILEVWLEYFVTVVILRLQIGLRKGSNISGEKVGESISGTHGRSCVEVEETTGAETRLVDFVFLIGDECGTERQIVRTNDFGHVIAIGVDGVCVVPRNKAGVFGEAAVG
jgi:hypothetical protein